MDQLAPRRQSLPVPHASPAFVPSWAPQGPDTHSHTSSPSRPYHVDTQTYGSGCAPAEQSDSYPYDGTHAAESVAAWSQSAAQQTSQTSPSTAAHRCFNPGGESLQAAPSVNITITGACTCQSPVKPCARASLQEPLQSSDRQNSVVLNPEASLAHLHQPAASAGEAAREASRAVQFSAGMEEAGRAGPEGDAQGGQQATEASVDTAALQKEVTELRHQVHTADMHAFFVMLSSVQGLVNPDNSSDAPTDFCTAAVLSQPQVYVILPSIIVLHCIRDSEYVSK